MTEHPLFPDQSPREPGSDAGANQAPDYIESLPYRWNAPSTSKRAAESAARRAPNARARVFGFIRDCGAFGATADEAAAALGMPIQTASPRLLELRRDGLIVDAGCERATRWGCAARVYVVASEGGAE